jgi:hypothetical protein
MPVELLRFIKQYFILFFHYTEIKQDLRSKKGLDKNFKICDSIVSE